METIALTLSVVLLISLLGAGVHVAVSLALAGIVGLSFIIGPPAALEMLGLAAYREVGNWMYTVIPLFILMGEMIHRGGFTEDIYKAAYKWFAWLPGGLAMATIAGCAGFSMACGSSLATAAAFTPIAIPEMLRYNYSKKLALGAVAAGGTLGVMIPPSIGLVIYGMVTNTSIGKLLIAGFIPGFILAGLFMLYIFVRVLMKPQEAPSGPQFSMREKVTSLRGIWSVLVLAVMVLGGIYLGIATPTEAAAVGAFSAFLIVLISRRLTSADFWSALVSTAQTSAMIFVIFFAAMLFSMTITLVQVPQAIVEFIGYFQIPAYLVLILVYGLFILLGMFVDPTSMVLITVPVCFPIVMAMGYDPIWFGVVTVVMVEIAALTPPIGLNVFVIRSVYPDASLGEIFNSVWPFFGMQLIALVLFTAFPDIVMWAPRMMR
jgi:tripartite ATP-independent transporter DctM subunit